MTAKKHWQKFLKWQPFRIDTHTGFTLNVGSFGLFVPITIHISRRMVVITVCRIGVWPALFQVWIDNEVSGWRVIAAFSSIFFVTLSTWRSWLEKLQCVLQR